MESEDSPIQNYVTGEAVHAGDRVRYGDTYASVVFVSDGEREEYSSGYEDHSGADRCVVICDDDGELTDLTEPDEMLTFIERG